MFLAFFFLPLVIPYIVTLLLLKFAFHVPKLQPLTLLGIFIIGGLFSHFFEGVGGFAIGMILSFLSYLALIGIAFFKKYNLTKMQAIMLAIIIGVLNLVTGIFLTNFVLSLLLK